MLSGEWRIGLPMSSSDIAVSVRGLSKAYTIAHNEQQSYLAQSLLHRLKNPFQRQEKETFWALKDVSFEIKQGEVLGIIGRNGAGKSTLLKILSRITKPTVGEIDITGRLSSLLEVGTGFHPELTGRENIYLNGSILGMTRREIAKQFDAIVEFSGVEKFLDTPVKRYSSGMYVRLAFAVSAHLASDILVVDEVLAVGDMSFQKKCLGKMQDVAETGRTVILVSHQMNTVTRLCSTAILLSDGQLVEKGRADIIAARYMSGQSGSRAVREWDDITTAPGNEIVRLRAVRVCDETGTPAEAIEISTPIGIEIEYEVLCGGTVLCPNFHLYNDEGTCVFISNEHDPDWFRRPRPLGRFVSRARIPGNFLAEGGFYVHAAISTMVPLHIHCWEKDTVAFHVMDSLDGGGARGDYAGHMPGVVRPLLNWTTRCVAAESSSPLDAVSAVG
jgi:lipopolysaccharide transport system ATP-binding protein